MSVVREREAKGSVDDVAARLEQAVAEQGYGVLGSIDLGEKMRAKGVAFDRACRVFEVCNPQRAKQVLDRDISISTALPCRIAVYERDGAVHVATMRPTAILRGFEVPELDAEAGRVESDLEAILEKVARGG